VRYDNDGATKDKDMKVAIIGCGNMAAVHLPHVLSHETVESVSIADINEQRLEETAKRFHIMRRYTDFELMLKEQKPDVVHILTPPATHAEVAIKAMELGAHILVEKPMATTYTEAEAMMAVAKQQGVKLCVDHNFLFDPVMIEARELVSKGAVGRIVYVDACYTYDVRRSRGFLDVPSGRESHWLSQLPGGLVLDLVPHPLSIVLHFLGKPQKAWVAKQNNGLLPNDWPDELRVSLQGSQITGSVGVSLGGRPDCFTCNIYGTRMTIHVNISNMSIVTRKVRPVPKPLVRALDNFEQAGQLLTSTLANSFKVGLGMSASPGMGGVKQVIKEFYRSIERKSEPPVTGAEGKIVTEVVDEILRQVSDGADLSLTPHRDDSSNLHGPRPKMIQARTTKAALVTGATGFIGSHLVARLVEDGHQVRALARTSSDLSYLQQQPVEIAYGDLRDERALKHALKGIDIVYHAGAAMRGSWEEYHESTIRGTERMLSLSLEAGVQRFVHLSSLVVYHVYDKPRNACITESCPYEENAKAVGPYAHAKVEAEKLVFRFYEQGLPVSVIRPGLVYGPRGPVMFPHIGYRVHKKIFVAIGKGDNLIPFTYIGNTVDAIMLASENPEAIGQAFHIVDDGDITQRQYLARYMAETLARFKTVSLPFPLLLLAIKQVDLLRRLGVLKPASAPSYYGLVTKYKSLRYDTSKAKKDLQWQPQVTLEEGLKRTFEWYRSSKQTFI
jgi:predicted dehydrogenase/nucleoside-diphosphate-sugar epimerase